MKIREVTLALGCNLGNRTETLASARNFISEEVGPIIHASPELTTKAWGVANQPDYLNQVVVVQSTSLNDVFEGTGLADWLHQLLNTTQAIENTLGRERNVHWGPRTCDIDIIFVDRLRFESERLSLPHPWWKQRDFVGGLLAGDPNFSLPFG